MPGAPGPNAEAAWSQRHSTPLVGPAAGAVSLATTCWPAASDANGAGWSTRTTWRADEPRPTGGCPDGSAGRGDTGDVPGFVDPRPHQEAELRSLQEQLAAATDEPEQTRIKQEITELEQSMGRGHGFWRFFVGWRHRSDPW
jgi:hypothetical protein